jgi:multiple sugar transport system ATP-binding protein
MSSLTLDRVHKTYGAQVAVRDVTLTIADGELLVLVGPSGSGKSTVLRLIAGLEWPTAGRILLGDEDVTAVPPERRDLAMVFQSYALYPHKTVRENLAFGLRVRGTPAAAIRDRVHQAAATLGIDALLDRKPAQLSGGQRQRVALGRANVREPRAFLLDEPLSNLDPLLRVETRAELALLHRRLAATMVYVTHDQEEAMTLGGRIAVMRDGRVEQVGAPLEIFERPANVFVATFVGSPAMNIWHSDVTRTDAGARLAGEGLSLTVDAATAARLHTSRALVGVRPHDLLISSRADADVGGRVEVVEPLGATAVVHVRVGHHSARPIRVVVPAGRIPAIDEEIGVRIPRERIHLFDEDSGAALYA